MEDEINSQRICDYTPKCKKFANYRKNKTDTNYICKTHYKQYIKKGGKRLNKIKTINCNNLHTPMLLSKINNILDTKYKYFSQVDYVLLEMQPLMRQQMRTISNHLYSYFSIRGVLDNNMEGVFFVNANGKLRIDEETTSATENTYDNRKKLAVDYCKKYISEYESEFLDFFENSKKKDDLSDSLLQCIFYIDNILKL